MRNVKAFGIAFLAVVAFCAVVAAAAQANAPRWTVTEGGVAKTLQNGEERTGSGTTTGVTTLVSGSFKFEMKGGCTTHGNIKGSGAGAPGTFTGTMHCKEVLLTSMPTCKVHSPGLMDGTVVSENLLGTLVWFQPSSTEDSKVGMLFQAEKAGAETKGLLATIELTGCGLAGLYQLKNELLCESGPAAAITGHAVDGTLNCPDPALSSYRTNQTRTRTPDTITPLQLGGANATFTAHTANLRLTNNVEWGIEPG